METLAETSCGKTDTQINGGGNRTPRLSSARVTEYAKRQVRAVCKCVEASSVDDVHLNMHNRLPSFASSMIIDRIDNLNFTSCSRTHVHQFLLFARSYASRPAMYGNTLQYDVHAFGYNSAESERIWMKSAAL